MTYKPLTKFLEAFGICGYAVTLPGRNGRGTASMFRNMSDILANLPTEFAKFHKENSLGDQPLLFFGHSFGGLVAFELYKAIATNNEYPIVVEKIIVSAVRCPNNLTEINKDKMSVFHHKQTDQELIDYMRSIGGESYSTLRHEAIYNT